jgi:hypothetical protein
MESHRILSFERGVLYLKLKETFNTYKMQISCTLARISREEVEVVKADSKGEVSSTSMTLSAGEMNLLERGRTMVKGWWDSNPLGERCVLLECGHIVNWDEWNEQMNEHSDTPGEYTVPGEDTCYCFECETSYPVHRFNSRDFEQVEAAAR